MGQLCEIICKYMVKLSLYIFFFKRSGPKFCVAISLPNVNEFWVLGIICVTWVAWRNGNPARSCFRLCKLFQFIWGNHWRDETCTNKGVRGAEWQRATLARSRCTIAVEAKPEFALSITSWSSPHARRPTFSLFLRGSICGQWTLSIKGWAQSSLMHCLVNRLVMFWENGEV